METPPTFVLENSDVNTQTFKNTHKCFFEHKQNTEIKLSAENLYSYLKLN